MNSPKECQFFKVRAYDVRYYNPRNGKIHPCRRTIRDLVTQPESFNMTDIGLALLNHEREKLGLKEIRVENLAPVDLADYRWVMRAACGV